VSVSSLRFILFGEDRVTATSDSNVFEVRGIDFTEDVPTSSPTSTYPPANAILPPRVTSPCTADLCEDPYSAACKVYTIVYCQDISDVDGGCQFVLHPAVAAGVFTERGIFD